MFGLNVKFVALPVPEIIGSTPKIWAVTAYAQAPVAALGLQIWVG